MTPAVHQALGHATDVVASAHLEHHAIVNATPERDCLADELRDLFRAHAVPAATQRRVAQHLRRVLELNADQARAAREAAGLLDALAVVREDRLPARLGVRAIVRRLRPALVLLRDPAGRSAREVVDARGVVRDVLAAAGDAAFTASVRHELREASWRCLCLLADRDPEVAARRGVVRHRDGRRCARARHVARGADARRRERLPVRRVARVLVPRRECRVTAIDRCAACEAPATWTNPYRSLCDGCLDARDEQAHRDLHALAAPAWWERRADCPLCVALDADERRRDRDEVPF